MTSGITSVLDSLQDLRYTYDPNGNVLTIRKKNGRVAFCVRDNGEQIDRCP